MRATAVKVGTSAAYVHRMELMRHCVGESRASKTTIDLSNVLSDAVSLQELVADLFLPFAQLQVDQIIALHTQDEGDKQGDAHSAQTTVQGSDRDGGSGGGGRAASRQTTGDEEGRGKEGHEGGREHEVHHFTTAIAGAMAGANQLGTVLHSTVARMASVFADIAVYFLLCFNAIAYGEVTVIERKQSRSIASKKRGRAPSSKPASKGRKQVPATVCHRIAAIESGDRCVEMKRHVIQEGKRVLLGTSCRYWSAPS